MPDNFLWKQINMKFTKKKYFRLKLIIIKAKWLMKEKTPFDIASWVLVQYYGMYIYKQIQYVL